MPSPKITKNPELPEATGLSRNQFDAGTIRAAFPDTMLSNSSLSGLEFEVHLARQTKSLTSMEIPEGIPSYNISQMNDISLTTDATLTDSTLSSDCPMNATSDADAGRDALFTFPNEICEKVINRKFNLNSHRKSHVVGISFPVGDCAKIFFPAERTSATP